MPLIFSAENAKKTRCIRRRAILLCPKLSFGNNDAPSLSLIQIDVITSRCVWTKSIFLEWNWIFVLLFIIMAAFLWILRISEHPFQMAAVLPLSLAGSFWVLTQYILLLLPILNNVHKKTVYLGMLHEHSSEVSVI